MANGQLTPPHQLQGLTLSSGWLVGSKVERRAEDTGGNFSVGYECVHVTGATGFLKAIDLYEAIQDVEGDVLQNLNLFIQEVQGERALLGECRSMDRVVTAVATGDIRELNGNTLQIPVPYIIFERADSSAQRALHNAQPAQAWCLRTLHHVAVGLWQMHGSMIAHQDVKLSNVLLFGDDVGAKISDLGRSVQQGRSVPHDDMPWPGDMAYAPPEFAYGYVPAEFNARRFASDLYLLGSCACAIFTGVSVNGLLYDELPSDFHPRWQQGGYTGTFEEVLPHLRDAFERVLEKVRAAIPEDAPHRDSVVEMISQWCDPRSLGAWTSTDARS